MDSFIDGLWAMRVLPIVVALLILMMIAVLLAEAIRRHFCKHVCTTVNMSNDRVCLRCRANLGKVDV